MEWWITTSQVSLIVVGWTDITSPDIHVASYIRGSSRAFPIPVVITKKQRHVNLGKTRRSRLAVRVTAFWAASDVKAFICWTVTATKFKLSWEKSHNKSWKMHEVFISSDVRNTGAHEGCGAKIVCIKVPGGGGPKVGGRKCPGKMFPSLLAHFQWRPHRNHLVNFYLKL